VFEIKQHRPIGAYLSQNGPYLLVFDKLGAVEEKFKLRTGNYIDVNICK
jgi:hypothetical protein